ncbi:MAG: hypothetical protein ACRD21_25620, partial [Vicinamibacteria bacterium]
LGSVADAIEVDAGMERAAEAFLDAALQRVRVEDESDVERALDLLASEEEAGRSELLVESLSTPGAEDRRAVLTELQSRGFEGLVGLLSDRVRVTGTPLPTGLPDAILVTTLEQAIRCYREIPAAYVSLSGEVVTPPGVVSLGPGGASAGLLLTRREIRELEERASAARSRFEEGSATRRVLQGEIENETRRLAALREELHGLEKTLVSLEHRSGQLDEDLSRAARKRDVLESERSRADSERNAFGAKRIEMEAALENEEKTKSDAESSLESLRAEMTSRRESVESLQVKAAQEQSRLAALRERRDAVAVDVERLREGVAELSSRLEAAKREQTGLTDRETSLTEGVERSQREQQSSVSARAGKIERGRALEAGVAILARRIEVTDSALKTRRRELESVRERRSAEEVVLAREESDRNHLHQSFESAFSIPLARAAAELTPAELSRDEEET